MYSGRGERYTTSSSSPRLQTPSSSVLPPPLLLVLAINEESIYRRIRLISKCLIAPSRKNHVRSEHAADDGIAVPPGYYEDFCSATAANVNVPSFSQSEKLAVLHRLRNLLAIPLASTSPAKSGFIQVGDHEENQCSKVISNTSYFKRISYIKPGKEGRDLGEKSSKDRNLDQDDNGIIFRDYSRNHSHHPVGTGEITCSIEYTAGDSLIGKKATLNSWSIGDFIRSYLFRKVVVFCSGNATADQTVSLGTAVKNAYKSSSEINARISTERNSHKQQSSTSTEVSSSALAFVPGTSATGKLEVALSSLENPKMKEEKQLEFILKSLVSGGVAGMCAKTTVAPLDRMKILLQAHSKHYSHLGVFSGLRGIVQKERFIALYKGNGAQMVRIFPYAATQFTSFEMYKKFLGEDSHVARFSAGSMAGVTAVALTYPLDTIRARLAFQVTGEHVYNGIYSCALHIFREEGGVRALYRGFIPTVCGMIPYAGLSFYCFESFKYLCMKYLSKYTCKSHSTNTGGLVLLLYAKLLCGGVAGAAAQTVAYPLDVTRRRMQLAMMDEKTKKFGLGMVSTIKLIYQENGVYRGLYRGMSINYLRAIPMVAVSFSTYELVKQGLKLDTGLPIKTG